MKVYRFKDDYHVNRWRIISMALAFGLSLVSIFGLIWLWGPIFACVSMKYFRCRVLSEGTKLKAIKDRYLRCKIGLRIYLMIFCEMAIVLGLPLMISILAFCNEYIIWNSPIDNGLVNFISWFILGGDVDIGAVVINYSAIGFLYAYSIIFVLSFFMWCRAIHVLIIPLMDDRFFSNKTKIFYSPWIAYDKIGMFYGINSFIFLAVIFKGALQNLVSNEQTAYLFVPYMIFFAFLNSLTLFTCHRSTYESFKIRDRLRKSSMQRGTSCH